MEAVRQQFLHHHPQLLVSGFTLQVQGCCNIVAVVRNLVRHTGHLLRLHLVSIRNQVDHRGVVSDKVPAYQAKPMHPFAGGTMLDGYLAIPNIRI